jgi:hypothetical protein
MSTKELEELASTDTARRNLPEHKE